MREHSITVVNRTEDVEKRAAKIAQDNLREEQHRPMGRGKWKPKKWMKKLALHFGEEYYRQRGIKRAREAILDTNNVLVDVDTMRTGDIRNPYRKLKSDAAGEAKIEQVHLPDEVQEKKFQQTQKVQGALKQMFINEVLLPIVDGKIMAESSVQRKLRKFVKNHSKDTNKTVANQIKNIFGKKATDYGKMAEFFATDVYEAGEAIRDDLQENNYSRNDIADHIDLTFANASWAAASKEHRTVVDRAVTAVHKRPWARAIVNETAVGAIASATTFALMRGSTRALSALTMGAGAGAIIGATERNRNLKKDMASHRADGEYSQTWSKAAKRRGKLDQYRYTELASVADMLRNDTQRDTVNGDFRSLQTLLQLPDTQDNRDALVTRIAEIKERLRFSAQKQTGFITYPEDGHVEQGRLALVKGITVGKASLVDRLVTEGIDEQQAKATVNQWVGESTEKWKKRFAKDKKKQQRKFFGYRMRSSLAHGVIGGAIGMASGAVAQEATAGIMRLSGEKVAPTILEKPFINEDELKVKALAEYREFAESQIASQPRDIWTAHDTSVDHREWYAYNSPGSNGNELKLHTVKEDAGIDLVMQNMGWSSQSELKPPHLYVPNVENAGQAAFAITQPGQEKNPVIVMADRMGRLDLDPTNANPRDIVRFANGTAMQTGEFSQQILNPEAYAARPNGDIATELSGLRGAFAIGGNHGGLGEISAGRVVEQDGKTVWQSFATIFGTGRTHTPEVTIPPMPNIQIENPTEVPAIPIVVTPRKPLEQSARTAA